MTRRERDKRPDSPAVRLLDALAAGDFEGVLAQCSESTRVVAENMRWSCQGTEAIADNLADAYAAFEGLTLEPRVRHIGFGLVIEDARVRDGAAAEAARRTPSHAADDPSAATANGGTGAEPTGSTADAVARHDASRGVNVWRDPGDSDEATPLDMPLRLTVRHDDLQVHEVTLSFPAALYKRALGLRVDPFEMSLSEIQSAFIAPVGGEFTTHTLARRELEMTPPPPPEAAPPLRAPEEEQPRKRRGGLAVLAVLVVLAAVLGGGWFVLKGNQGATVTADPPTSTHTKPSSPRTSSPPTTSVTTAPQPTARGSRKPNVTLTSDLAFGFNSATLSSAAKGAIAKVAQQVVQAKLSGTIYVDGYTDSLGSAAYGKVLSQRRADAVATYLRAKVGNAPVFVVPVGHGEADPVASNATAAGRVANRRVTITLPKPS